MERTYIECGIWHLGGRKKQREVFLSILGTPYTRHSRLLLVPAAGAIGGEVLNGLRKRFFLEEDQEDDTQKDDVKGNNISRNNMPRSNILPQRLATLKRAQLPNSRVFFAKYKRVNNHALAPTRVRINRTYVNKVGPRRQR